MTYTGTITIDKLADMINMKPTLGRDPDTTAFKITNHYDDKILPPQTGGDGSHILIFMRELVMSYGWRYGKVKMEMQIGKVLL